MATKITLRANNHYPAFDNGDERNDIRNAQFHAYCKGATEQQKIDMSAFSIAFCDHFCSQAKRISCDAKDTTCTALASFLKQATEE